MAARLLQLHGAIVDLIYYVDAFPEPGGEAIVRKFDIAAGGGFNAMASATRQGMSVTYAGALGTGPFGDMVANALSTENIKPLLPRDSDRDQGCCTVMVDPSGERSFVAAEGAEGYVRESDLNRIQLSDYGWSMLSGYTLYYQGSVAAFTQWLSRNTEVPNLVFDPAPIIASICPDALTVAISSAAWVTANTSEAEFLTGEANPVTAAQSLADGRCGAVVRNAEKGCVVAWDGQVQSIPAHAVTTVDTNGAGDTHLGAFIASLARGCCPSTAARYANVAAALSTTHFGPACAPDFATVEETLRLTQAK